VNAIAVNSTGTLVASASDDKHVRLWRFSDRRTIAIFKHSDNVYCVAFSIDGKHIISGSANKKVSQWAIPEVSLENSPQERVVEVRSYSSTVHSLSHLAQELVVVRGSKRTVIKQCKSALHFLPLCLLPH
jgi:WD40 repeat protein